MTFQDYFAKFREIFMSADVSKLDGDIAFQINLTGEGSGTFYAEYKNGKLSVEPYDYRDRDAALTADSKDFLKIAEGKMDPIQAYFLGKLKVDGDVSKALALKNMVR
ncbi:MAG: SCP2 sterol-binding domain-containing protein [Oscillospiraceae bacterium]|nr:SCP2 sterol-binding domain-containing protein [Oscillospiraceae bacterium]